MPTTGPLAVYSFPYRLSHVQRFRFGQYLENTLFRRRFLARSLETPTYIAFGFTSDVSMKFTAFIFRIIQQMTNKTVSDATKIPRLYVANTVIIRPFGHVSTQWKKWLRRGKERQNLWITSIWLSIGSFHGPTKTLLTIVGTIHYDW